MNKVEEYKSTKTYHAFVPPDMLKCKREMLAIDLKGLIWYDEESDEIISASCSLGAKKCMM